MLARLSKENKRKHVAERSGRIYLENIRRSSQACHGWITHRFVAFHFPFQPPTNGLCLPHWARVLHRQISRFSSQSRTLPWTRARTRSPCIVNDGSRCFDSLPSSFLFPFVSLIFSYRKPNAFVGQAPRRLENSNTLFLCRLAIPSVPLSRTGGSLDQQQPRVSPIAIHAHPRTSFSYAIIFAIRPNGNPGEELPKNIRVQKG